MAPTKMKMDALNESLLQESSKTFQETVGLQWEWDHFVKLHKIIGQIQEKEAARDAGDSLQELNLKNGKSRMKSVQPFMDWLEVHEVNTSKLKIQNMGSNTGLGLVTKVPIKAGDEVLVIPDKIMMATVNVRESKLKILAEKDPVIRSMPNVLLSLFLLYEKFVTKEASFWKPYIDLLPSSYDTVLYFSVEEMQLLRHSQNGFRKKNVTIPYRIYSNKATWSFFKLTTFDYGTALIRSEALRMYRHIARQYAYFHGVFRKATDSASRALRTVFTYKRYAWAASTAMTRQNSLTRPGESKDELCLIPLWDLCNHEATGQFSNSYHPEEKYLACYASHDYDVNTEFLIYYGERTSVDHFVHGGFVPETFFADIFNLEIGIGIHDRELLRKEAILKGFGMKCQESFAVKPASLAAMKLKSIFIFVRIFQADKELLDQLEANLGDWSSLTLPTEEVWQFLATRFTILKVSAENSKLNLLKSICRGKDEQSLSSKQKMIVQLLQNEVKLLEILAHCANDQLLQLQREKDIQSVDF